MPRKKKDPITGVGRDPDDKLIVQKSNPLSVLWRSDLTLAEFKIMDTYLARINSHRPDQRAVRFEKGEIEQLLGVKKINISELKDRVAHLMRPLIIDDSPRRFRGICLFEEAQCEADEYGVWQVDLTCTEKAMQYFFNLDKIGYYRYKLRCISGITSRYSYILFLYLEQNRFRKSWEVPLDELKHYLNCDQEASYKQFKVFNDRILKLCKKELDEKTECHFTYETIKKGRSVVAIRFTLETISVELPEALDQMTFDDTLPPDDLLRSAVPEFTDVEFDAIWEVLVTVPDNKLPYHVDVYDQYGNPDITFRRYHYLSQKIKMLDAAAAAADKRKKPIKNRFAYFMKMLRADASPASDTD